MSDLNEPQRAAVRQTDGPVLILAGAGTGKTRAITARVAHLISTGVSPKKILAVTFTNKAATEMRERVGGMVAKSAAKDLTICTFHSLCVRILRQGIDKLGYKKNFSIYVASDQVGLIKKILVRQGAKDEIEPFVALSLISKSKNKGVPVGKGSEDLMVSVMNEYQNTLKLQNAVDFDDLLLLTVQLLGDFPDVLAHWQSTYSHIMVDEFQDTNSVQMRIVMLLGGRHNNVCVVGDDDQSIYGWRGAEVSNILEFERFFPNPAVIKLEQNYRSTTPILSTANGLIRHNKNRREKKLWTSVESEERVRLIGMTDDKIEAEFVTNEIWEIKNTTRGEWEDFAILFRMNSQSRVYEEHLRKAKIPYRIVGGKSFYDRREVRDVLSYLQVLANRDDDVGMLRILNNPPRGIGTTTQSLATDESLRRDTSVAEVLHDEEFRADLSTKARGAVERFLELIAEYASFAEAPGCDLRALVERLLEEIGYYPHMKRSCKNPEEEAMRESNIREFLVGLADAKGLQKFLDDIALQSDREEDDIEKKSGVCLITLHAAKGLEFPEVYLVGLEEGILPHSRSVEEGSRDEERRLLYVGITRAQRRFTMTYCMGRKRWGQVMPCYPSSFISELDEAFVDHTSHKEIMSTLVEPEDMASQFGMMRAMLGKMTTTSRRRVDLRRGAAIFADAPMGTATNKPVKFKVGNETLIKVLPSASEKLTGLLRKQGRAEHGALRVAVVGGGCSGLQYKMDLVDGPADRDIMVESASVRVVIDPKSALFVTGSELDFSEDLQSGGFKVTNPNAVVTCSCGESFAA